MKVNKDSLLRGVLLVQRQAMPVVVGVVLLGVAAAVVWLWWLGPEWRWREQQPLVDLPVRIAATVLLVMLPLLAWSAWVHRRNRSIVREQKRQRREVEDPCLVYLQAQQRSLDSSLARLRDSQGGRGHRYDVPWYLILGEQNAGKSSFVSRSDQRFALARTDGATQRASTDPDLAFGIDWWVGDDAVLIDPPGEFISQPERPARVVKPIKEEGGDNNTLPAVQEAALTARAPAEPTGLPASVEQRLWRHMIGWLAQNRSRRPLNGVVLLVDMVNLFGRSAKARRDLAFMLRARLTELGGELGTRLPLYVVMSKFDLLDGFEELFAALPAREREEVQGFTFTLGSVKDFDAWLQELEGAYQGFLGRLGRQLMSATVGAPGTTGKSACSLLRELSGAQEMLLNFLGDVLVSDRYSTPPLVRGLYFSSVYQRGEVRNLLADASARAFAFAAPALSTKPQGTSVVYFAQRLLQRVVYPEAGLAGDNRKVARRKGRLLKGGAVAASVCGLAMAGGWAYFYSVNRDKAEQVLEKSLAFSNTSTDAKDDLTGRSLLLPLNEIRDAVSLYGDYRSGWSVFTDMGLYQGKAIGPQVDQAYLNALAQRFLPVIAGGVAASVMQAAPGSDEQLAALRVYRMIEDRGNRRAEMVEQWMAREWQRAYPGQGQLQAALMRHLRYALAYADVELPEYRKVVAQAQQQLRKLPLAERVYIGLRQQAREQLHGELDLRNEIGPAFDIVYRPLAERDHQATVDANLSLPPLLTATGFRDYFDQHSQNVADLALVDQWVLGERRSLDYSDMDRQALAERLRALYSADYIDSWRRVLNQFSVAEFSDLAHALGVLEQVSGPAAPIRRLLETVRSNTLIYPQAADSEKESNADPQVRMQAMGIYRSFAGLSGMLDVRGDKPSYHDETLQAISAVHDYLKAVQDSPDRGKAALALVLSRFSETAPDPIRNLQRIATGLPEPLNRHVRQLAEQTSQVLMVMALRELEQRWDAEVYSVYQERLASRYPIDPAGPDVSLKDFEAFFGPQGQLKRFQDQYLAVFLEDNLDALYSRADEGYLVRPEVMVQLKQAEAIRNAFFDNRGELNVSFGLEPLAISGGLRGSVFDLDGQLHAFADRGKEPIGMTWPGPAGESGHSRVTLVQVAGTTVSLGYHGPWSLYRLLSRGGLNARTSTSIDLAFMIAGDTARYKVHTPGANNPFTRQLFAGFALPQRLLRDGTASEVAGR
ncbi:type VI secretion system membrane subunit TssM [Pseudomonas sp. ABFPK]|uniref:type VI secretion system membrane subunit TssM n=1 Tax=Pseudomonas sp. ABFPK TaxID=1636605 RepID=UPI000778ACCA|nr:type VI secretion system membrane subunit TssM [Pseudomonas sp. ABFPK]KYC20597.1 type VI secretion protein VasK [Pseudomonas sp. ABFPK]